MGRKAGDKKGGGRGTKGQSKSQATSRAADGPTIKVKSGKALEISQKNAARIRELLQQEPEPIRQDAKARKRSAEELNVVYNDLVGYAFQHQDIQSALTAVQGSTLSDALDWLCVHVPPDRLPPRFAAGAMSHKAEAVTGMKAATESTLAKKSEAEKKMEKEKQKAELEALRQRSAAAAKAKKAEEAARQQKDKANIVAQYGQYDEISESESESAQSVVEDWEIWGDPREVERRRAERSRAAQLNMLSPEERQLQLAKELKTAMDSAKQAKSSGNKKQKEVAGEVIRHVKLEISSLGIKEAVIHQLIAKHFKSAEDTSSSRPAKQEAPAPEESAPEPAAPAEIQESWEEGAEEPAPAAAAGSRSNGKDATTQQQPPQTSSNCAKNGDSKSPEDEWPPVSANSRDGWDPQRATNAAQPTKGDEEEFDPNILWDEEDTAADIETTEAAPINDGSEAGLPNVPLRRKPLKAKPVAQELPMAAPKALLQQFCHKRKPPLPAPRLQKISRPGEPPRYACTIVFPQAKVSKSKKAQANGAAAVPSGTRTWQVPEADDLWEEIQDAQDAVALRALWELMPELTQEYQLRPALRALWDKWMDPGTEIAVESHVADQALFVANLRKRLEASDEESKCTASVQDQHAHTAQENVPAEPQPNEPQDDTEALEDASRKAVHDAAESQSMRRQQLAFAKSEVGQEWARKRESLPVYQVRDQLLESLTSGHMAVLSGDTGCGKTTQVPQYLLEQEIEQGRGATCSIICTQPRRIAAISVADRVAQERAEPPPGKRGSRVGYHVRLDPAVTKDTRLMFCTTGILLRRLAADPTLSEVSHVVVDEVHERALQSDFLLALLRRLVAERARTPRPLKVVLMSATIDLNLLSTYLGGCPTMSAKGRTFPVEQFFLEDAYEMTAYRLADDAPAALRPSRDQSFRKSVQKQGGKQSHLLREGWGDDAKIQDRVLNKFYDPDALAGYSRFVHTNIERVDETAIDFELLDDLIRHIDVTEDEGAILVFLPGMMEIMNLVDRLQGSHQCATLNYDLLQNIEMIHALNNFQQDKHIIIPLHSTIAPEDQKRAFVRPPFGVRKIVVSTNIAETSVTIEDVVYVVDSGKLKERRFNAARGISMLVLDHVSQASARQRKGRAGRVRKGKCYSLFTRQCHDTRMPAFQVPEIMRVPLEELVLQIHLLELGSASDFLPELLQPPPQKAVDAAVSSLQTIGALDEQENLTPLGVYLAQLPVDARLGKLLVTSVFMCCLSDALTIAACLSYKTPFSTAFAAAEAAELARKAFASEKSECIASQQQSDHLVMLAAYSGWQAALVKGGPRLAREYIKKHCLSYQTLQMLKDMRYQFATMLADVKLVAKPERMERGFPWVDDPSARWNSQSGRPAVVKGALSAALYPQVACMDSETQDSKKPAWLANDLSVSVHPSSVLHTLLSNQYLSPFVLFSEKMQTSSVYMRDITVVPAIALVLFGGHLDVHHDSGYILLDSWLKVKAAAQTAVLVKKLRSAWLAMMDARVKDPTAVYTAQQRVVLDVTIDLLLESGL